MALPIIGAVVEVVKAVIDKFPDPKQKAEALQKLEELQQSGDLAAMAQQVEINKIEAASSDKFTSRWRPFIGWVCGSALAMQLLVIPLAVQISEIAHHPVKMVVLDTTLLSTLVVGMLGFGGMRTVEKLNKVA